MPPSEAQEAVERFSRALAAQERAASARVIREYAPVYRRLQQDTLGLVRLAQSEGLKPWQTMRLKRYRDLERQFKSSAAKFATAAADEITSAQRAAVGLSRRATAQTVTSGLPRGVTMDNLARLGIGWNRLPEEAFTNFVGIAADGQPVGRLLADLGTDAAPQVRAAIGEGIALGKGPRETAQLVRVAAGMPLSRALRITRTETNRAYREATRLQYANNSQIVKGYRRHADQSERTCIACISLDGTLYGLDEPLNEHPNGRCALVPEIIDYQDLGLDVPPQPRPPNAQTWLQHQPESVQRNILGETRFQAYRAGDLNLSEVVGIQRSAVWGEMAVVRPLEWTMAGANVAGQSIQIPLKEYAHLQKLIAQKAAKKGQLSSAAAKLDKLRAAKPQTGTPNATRYDVASDTVDKMPPPIVKSDQFGTITSTSGELDDAYRVVRNNERAIRAQGEAGEDLVSAVNQWTAGGNDKMREGAKQWARGDTPAANVVEAIETRTGAVLAEAASNAPQMPFKTYRGMQIEKSSDEIKEIFQIGTQFDQQISSFSINQSKATSFARPTEAGKYQGKALAENLPQELRDKVPTSQSVVMRLDEGARGLNIEPISKFLGEKERIVSGRFEVTGITRTKVPWDDHGSIKSFDIWYIDVKQINTLGRDIT